MQLGTVVTKMQIGFSFRYLNRARGGEELGVGYSALVDAAKGTNEEGKEKKDRNGNA